MKHFYLPVLLTIISICVGRHNSVAQEQGGTKITQIAKVEIKVNSVKHNSCYGDKKGAINIMVSGGLPPYRHEWSNGATSQDIAGLVAGSYKVKIYDTYGCRDSLVVAVEQPEELKVLIDSTQDILCYGFRNGRLDVTVKGGVPPYVYIVSVLNICC